MTPKTPPSEFPTYAIIVLWSLLRHLPEALIGVNWLLVLIGIVCDLALAVCVYQLGKATGALEAWTECKKLCNEMIDTSVKTVTELCKKLTEKEKEVEELKATKKK